jgi:hypothetical protein
LGGRHARLSSRRAVGATEALHRRRPGGSVLARVRRPAGGGGLGGWTRGFPGRRAVGATQLSIAGGLAGRGLAACRGPWHQGARCAGAAHAVTGYDKEFRAIAAVAVGRGDTAAPPVDLCPIPMVQRIDVLGLKAASLVIAALAPDAQAESGAVPRAERGSPPIPRIYCLPRRECRQRTRSRPTKRRALRTRGIFPYPSGSPLLACLVSRHT